MTFILEISASNFLPFALEACVFFDMFINILGFHQHLQQYYHQLVIKFGGGRNKIR
jgi:hypothetical protein